MRLPSNRILVAGLVALAAVLAIAAGALALQGSSSSTVAQGGQSSTIALHVSSGSAPGRFAAQAVLTPSRVAPDFTLRDSVGHTITLSRFRGRAVILTFIYAHCPDVCPLIVAKLHQALALLGRRANRVAIVGVSVDPTGDQPKIVNAFIASHEMTGRLDYVIGTRAQLAPIWKEYSVAVAPHPHATVVGHAAVLYGIGASGRELTVYSASNFQPEMIAHDVPLLAAR